MAIVTRRLIILSLIVAIFAMLLAVAVVYADGNDHLAHARFCSSLNGTQCLQLN